MKITIRADSVQIEGYVNAVGRDSRLITDGSGYPYREQIAPGAFRAALDRVAEPVRMLLNHNAARVIGVNGENLTLAEDTIGLHAEATVTDPEAVEAARAGKLVGWSFGFIPLDTKDEYTESGHRVIVTELDLREVSLIDSSMVPVYAGTSVHTRADGEQEQIQLRANDGTAVYTVQTDGIVPAQKGEGRAAGQGEPVNYSDYDSAIRALKQKEKEKGMNEKELTERRAELVEQMEALTAGIKTEKRAFTAEEDVRFRELKGQIEAIDRTIQALEEQRALVSGAPQGCGKGQETQEQVEIRAFANIVRNRADSNITMGDNGAVVPKTIANRIIDKVKELSPLFRDAERYSVKGTLSIPYVDSGNDNITVAYATEFTDLESKSVKLLTVDLTDYLAGVLCKISKTLLNQTDINLVNFVINKMAAALADFCDREIIIGTTGKATGLSTVTNQVTSEAAEAVSVNDLIALKNAVNSKYQNGAYWVMAPATLTKIQQTLAGTSNYIVNSAVENDFTATLLGKPVHISENVAGLEAGAKSVYYLNPGQALAVKVNEDSVQVLNERYAAQHAIGIVEWIDFDAKIQNQQAVAVLVQKES